MITHFGLPGWMGPVLWRFALASLLCGVALDAMAQARLAGIFGDHMVLQRDAPIRIWGWAAPSETVRVTFNGHRRAARAGRDGRWQVMLPAAPAGGPHELTVHAANTLTLRDILVGEVWVCSGQSNMERELKYSLDAVQEVAASDHPAIRHVKIAHRIGLRPLDDIDPAPWQVSDPDHAGDFSAAAYFFARQLNRELGVPVGLINASWGGSNIETWTPLRAALADPDLAPIVRALPASAQAFAAQHRARMEALVQRWQPTLALGALDPESWSRDDAIDDGHWPGLDVPRIWEEQGLDGFDGIVWYRRRVDLSAAQASGDATLQLGMIDDCDETFINGQRVGGLCGWDTPRRYVVPSGLLHAGSNGVAVRVTDTGGAGGFHGDAAAVRLETAAGSIALAGRWKARVESVLVKTEPGMNDLPTLLFNGMVQPLTPLRIRGVLWYQGESNVPRAARYAGQFRRLIEDWRAHWGRRDMPFYYVQLASFLPLARNTLAGSTWAELREAQRQVLALPHTGMVVATDIGDANDIHPRNKQDVGARLARLALRDVHGRRVVASGPLYRTMRVAGRAIELRFSQLGGGLAVRGGAPLQGFTIADAGRRFQPAQARIDGNRVVVSSDAVAQPIAVRYGWVDNPEQANLVNREGLPASPFRTDRWPILTDGARFAP